MADAEGNARQSGLICLLRVITIYQIVKCLEIEEQNKQAMQVPEPSPYGPSWQQGCMVKWPHRKAGMGKLLWQLKIDGDKSNICFNISYKDLTHDQGNARQSGLICLLRVITIYQIVKCLEIEEQNKQAMQVPEPSPYGPSWQQGCMVKWPHRKAGMGKLLWQLKIDGGMGVSIMNMHC
uniref:Uncharacterized protein n=1 Tax=Oryza meridionalis TaxID=40149 RepID=A0A0E0D5Y9_9ORYZ